MANLSSNNLTTKCWFSTIRKWLVYEKDDILIYLALQILIQGSYYDNIYYHILGDNKILHAVIGLLTNKQPRIREACAILVIKLSEYQVGGELFSELNGGLLGYRLLLSDHDFLKLRAIQIMEIMSWFDNFKDAMIGTSVVNLIINQFNKSFEFSLLSLLYLAFAMFLKNLKSLIKEILE